MAADLIPVAQYLRMSTEHQQYSLDNQRQAIQAYADSHNLSVVKTYEDGAKSGVLLKRRDGLRQLLREVVDGSPEHRAVLVYDVMRSVDAIPLRSLDHYQENALVQTEM
jgi:DNA invertase Pin-like site-specific DNA recombinase